MAETEVYDIESGQWSVGPSLTFGRHQHTSVKMNDGNVMVIGGQAETEDGEELKPPPFLSFVETTIDAVCLHQQRNQFPATIVLQTMKVIEYQLVRIRGNFRKLVEDRNPLKYALGSDLCWPTSRQRRQVFPEQRILHHAQELPIGALASQAANSS